MRFFLFFLANLMAVGAWGQAFAPAEVAQWRQQAQRVRIVRDTWGVPHITGKSDADAVFGLLYAQCEDDFARVEDNYLTALGRQAEVGGEALLMQDLRQRLFLDSARAVAVYSHSPRWLKDLLHAFADGTNYYLATHPELRPRRLRRFQPWMPLLFSEGSIGGNVSVVPLDRLRAFYLNQKGAMGWQGAPWQQPPAALAEQEPVGSNGFAIAPGKSANGHALLLINPHTSFYFRSEVQVTSAAGLNAYGAVTWGQFFVYQGFNEKCGWMHTSSQADSMDEYLETVTEQDGQFFYKYDDKLLPVATDTLTLFYAKDGQRHKRRFTTYRTQHGPVVGKVGEQWLTVKMMNAPLAALTQSYLRTKAHDYASFREVMKLNGNATNNTVFADATGSIAYWHGNFIPRRPAGYDFSRPVDGSTSRTEWQGLHSVDELVQVRNPASGFIQNCNSSPFTVAGPTASSPAKSQYPTYLAPDAENYRSLNAVRILSHKKSFTLDTLIAAANDRHLLGFERLIPALIADYQLTIDAPGGTVPPDVGEAIATLRDWDFTCDTASVAQTIAVYWGERVHKLARSRMPDGPAADYLRVTAWAIAHLEPEDKINLLVEALEELTRAHGNWQIPWGQINRYQRLTGRIEESFSDDLPSRAVAFASSSWGSLAAFGARPYGTRRRYGSVGNSFVAVVEFGPRVVARSVTTGGASSHPDSPHFTDQAGSYCQGQFKEVWFYPEDVARHAGRTYRPGE